MNNEKQKGRTIQQLKISRRERLYKGIKWHSGQLSAIDKFNYLNSLLKGHASRAIQGLSLTEANYESANDIWMKGLEENNR